jgi:RES domain
MRNEADDISKGAVALSGTWYRLIPSRFPTINLYERIATPAHHPVLQRIEALTNPRVRDKKEAAAVESVDVETSPKFQNWNHAPFAYPNPEGSRYLSSLYGSLELFKSLNGALATAIRKREAFLAATANRPINLDMRVLRHDFSGKFVDRSDDPIDMAQADRWAIGEKLRAEGEHGVYYRCPELPHCYAVSLFDRDGLGPARQAEHYCLRWDGSKIAWYYLYSDTSDGLPISIDTIFAAPAA